MKLFNRFETLKYIIDNRCSIARFGDGEMALCLHNYFGRSTSIHFQKGSGKLKRKLLNALKNNSEKLLICYNNAIMMDGYLKVVIKYEQRSKTYNQFESIHTADDVGVACRETSSVQYVKWFNRIKKFLKKKIIGDATCFFLSFYYKEYREGRMLEVLHHLKKIFYERRILFVCPETPLFPPSFQSIVNNKIIASPISIDFLTIPDKNCFGEYNKILSQIVNYPEVDLVLLQCGPTATVLAAELTTEYGIQALDVGSLNIAISKAHREHGFVF